MATPKELAAFYSKLDTNKNGFRFEGLDSNVDCLIGPNLYNDISDYIVNPPKPQVKKIDLSICIESGIDCEFGDGDYPDIGKLERIKLNNDLYKYIKANDPHNDGWKQCKVREKNHIHYNESSVCPIPEGLKIRIVECSVKYGNYCTLEDRETSDYYNDFSWDNVIGFEVLNEADGWEY